MTIIKDDRWRWLRSLKAGDKVLVRGKGEDHIAIVTKVTAIHFFIGNARFDQYGRWGDDKVWKRIHPLDVATGDR